MVTTIKFSEFAAADLNDVTNTTVGVGSGVNITKPETNRWTNATRPDMPFNGLLGYNTDLSQYEFWDSVTTAWIQLSAGGAGTVVLVDTGEGLSGGPITNAGTIALAATAAHTLLANTTSGSAVPLPVTTLPLIMGGTGANLTADDGAIFYSTASAGALLASTPTSNKMLLSGASNAPVWSTSTVPSFSGISGNILTSDGTNWISAPPAETTGVSGLILDYAGTVVPLGFLACDGNAVSRSVYADLFTAIGTTWGIGDGTTTFNVPNLNRRTTIGSGGSGTAIIGNAVGDVGGEETHVQTLAEMHAHSHGPTSPGLKFLVGVPATTGTFNGVNNPGANNNAEFLTTDTQGSSAAANIVQLSAVVMKIIKT